MDSSLEKSGRSGASSGASSSATPGASAASSAARAGASSTGTGSSGRDQSICTFWLGERCFGLDVALVGEVVAVEAMTPVPKAPSEVLGLFNLRGTPVPLVDAAAVLSLEGRAGGHETAGGIALVIRHGDLVVALSIDRMEAVVEAARGALTPPAAKDEHPVVQGFLESGNRVVTIIGPTALLERLERLRPGAERRA